MKFAKSTLQKFAQRYGFALEQTSPSGRVYLLGLALAMPGKVTGPAFVNVGEDDEGYLHVQRPRNTYRRVMGNMHPSFSGGLKGLYEWLTYQGKKSSPTVSGDPCYEGAVTLKRMHPFRTIRKSDGKPTVRLAWVMHPGSIFSDRMEDAIELQPAHLEVAELFITKKMEPGIFRDWLIDHDYLKKS